MKTIKFLKRVTATRSGKRAHQQPFHSYTSFTKLHNRIQGQAARNIDYSLWIPITRNLLAKNMLSVIIIHITLPPHNKEQIPSPKNMTAISISITSAAPVSATYFRKNEWNASLAVIYAISMTFIRYYRRLYVPMLKYLFC